MPDYCLSRHAERDLSTIASYSLKNFGITQSRLFRDGLFKVFDILSDFPLIGSDQGHIKQNVRRHVFESHAIYYRIDKDGIVILRILGPGQDPLRHFS